MQYILLIFFIRFLNAVFQHRHFLLVCDMCLKKMNESLWVISAFWSLLYLEVSLGFKCFLYPPSGRALEIGESLLPSAHFFTVITIPFYIENWSTLKLKYCFIRFIVSIFQVKTKIYDALERPLGFSPSKRNVTLKTLLVPLQRIKNLL